MNETPRKRVRRPRKPTPPEETALPAGGVKTTGDDALGMTPPPLREFRRRSASGPVRGAFDYMGPALVLIGIGCVVWLGLTARRELGPPGGAGGQPNPTAAGPISVAEEPAKATSTPATTPLPETTPAPESTPLP